jgi:hypothetical protein
MQLTQDNVQDFVDGVMQYYKEKTLLGDTSYIDDYGSANLPIERRRVNTKLTVKQFDRGIAASRKLSKFSPAFLIWSPSSRNKYTTQNHEY